MAAVISTGNSSYATLNINVLDRAAEFVRAGIFSSTVTALLPRWFAGRDSEPN
jgi:hypothetical protein